MNLPDFTDLDVDVERYGPGGPLALGILGALLVVWTAPGVQAFGGLSDYGKVGVIITLMVGFGFVVAGGYTYRAIDTSTYVMTKDEDGPGDNDGEDG